MLHLKHQLLATCLERVFTLQIWFQNLPTTVVPPEPTLSDTCFCVRLHWEICKKCFYCILTRFAYLGDSCSVVDLFILVSPAKFNNSLLFLSRYERTRADYIEKLPKGKHSCKGVGKSEPDPAASVTTKDGVEIPLGQGITDLEKDSTLLYNEYPFQPSGLLLFIVHLILNVHGRHGRELYPIDSCVFDIF